MLQGDSSNLSFRSVDGVAVVDTSVSPACWRCQQELCLLCGAQKHDKGLCVDNHDLLLNELGDTNATWTKCPKCNGILERVSGCDHMTCLKSAGGCGYEFWFTCGCNFKQIHICARGGGISLPPGMNVPHARR